MAYVDFDERGEGPIALHVCDITLVLAVRAHALNPWLLPRLAALRAYYEPAPPTLVVDFGSVAPYAEALQSTCLAAGFGYLRVEDDGVYSQAIARNLGARHARTSLLFFSDVDCVGERDLFARLARFATAAEMGRVFDRVALLPVYHLAAGATAAVEAAQHPDERERALCQALQRAVFTQPGSSANYVDPQSNFLLIRRDFFDYTGGYNARFRGYGSEDFEFLLRVAQLQGAYPMPDAPLDAGLGPRSAEFFAERPYRGFRRLFELMSIEAELAGLRIAHLDHPRERAGNPWLEAWDRKRERFYTEASEVLSVRDALLRYDFLPRKKCAVVLLESPLAVDLALPLRLLDYALLPITPGPTALDAARTAFADGSVHALLLVVTSSPETAWASELTVLAERHAVRTLRAQFDVGTCSIHYAGLPECLAAEAVAHCAVPEPMPGQAVPAPLWFELSAPFNMRVRRLGLDGAFSAKSYGAVRAGVASRLLAVGRETARNSEPSQDELGRPRQRAAEAQFGKLRKLLRDPRRFLEDSRAPVLRRLGRALRSDSPREKP
jgi:predicted glycosyltransferase involved in capsule biosynthesis